ncbi:MAG: DUF1488 family protein [Burkholderiales bacterium]|nr:DUF1488 family protein [Burkholderiales bacterium]
MTLTPRMQLPEPYVGHEAVVIRVDTGRREVRAVVSREALEERFAAGHTPQDWLLAYQAHAEEIQAVVRAKVARASPEPVVISKYDFSRADAAGMTAR